MFSGFAPRTALSCRGIFISGGKASCLYKGIEKGTRVDARKNKEVETKKRKEPKEKERLLVLLRICFRLE